MDEPFEIRWHIDQQPCYLAKILDEILSVPVKGEQPQFAYLIAREEDANRVHLQGVIYSTMSISTFRKRFKIHTKVKGNKDYKLSSIRNEESALSYFLKEGNYIVSSQFEELVRPLSEIQPWIDKQQTLSDQVKELDKVYLDTGMDDDSYLNSLLSIYANHEVKTLYLHHIKAHWTALFNRRNKQGTQKIYMDPEDNTRYVSTPFNPRQVLVDSIKKFIVS